MMPDILDGNGLVLKDAQELREEIQESFKSIYGDDINIDADSPDGQRIEQLVQMSVDIREIIVYSFIKPRWLI